MASVITLIRLKRRSRKRGDAGHCGVYELRPAARGPNTDWNGPGWPKQGASNTRSRPGQWRGALSRPVFRPTVRAPYPARVPADSTNASRRPLPGRQRISMRDVGAPEPGRGRGRTQDRTVTDGRLGSGLDVKTLPPPDVARRRSGLQRRAWRTKAPRLRISRRGGSGFLRGAGE